MLEIIESGIGTKLRPPGGIFGRRLACSGGLSTTMVDVLALGLFGLLRPLEGYLCFLLLKSL